MIIGGVIAFCIVLLILAFVFPRLSRDPERGGQTILGFGRKGAGQAPGKAGELAQKPFSSAQKAVSKSGSAGRRGRGKLPL
jgi:hypothetical protein